MELTWCSLLLLLTAVGAEVATSGYKLTVICQKEGRLVQTLDRYVTVTLGNQSDVDETVQRFLRNVKDERSKIEDIVEWIGHPVNAFHLVERTVNGWRTVQQSINVSQPTTATQEFHLAWEGIIDEDGIWTSSDDVTIAAMGLERIYQTYDLDAKTLMSGTILNSSTSAFTSSDVITIANYMRMDDQIKWYESFLEICDVTEKESVSYKLAMAYHMEGMPKTALGILTELQATSTRSMETTIKSIRQKAESSKEDKPKERAVGPDIYLDNVYRQLCQGQIERVQVAPVLHCYNKVTRIPYYTVKEEVLNYVPRISRFHDVISDTEISQLQDTATQNLTRASVLYSNGSRLTTDSRIGVTSNLMYTTSVCLKLEKRVDLLTGLDTIFRQDLQTSQRFQVVNYGVGGHYIKHYDLMDQRKRAGITDGSYGHGDRIATWMYYLNTVAAGGATVFPILGLRILPIKGSAVFWYNMLPSGEMDDRSQHAACPVLLGTKWVTTKWILERGQELRKPCKTHPMAEHD